MSEMSPPPASQVGRTPIPKDLLEERRKMALSLKFRGFSMQSILSELNGLSSTKSWGFVSLRTLERDIAGYFRANRAVSSYEEPDHFKRLREAYILQIEGTIEKIVKSIEERDVKDDWKPFEKISALEKLFKMQVEFTEIQGWNYCKKESNRTKEGFTNYDEEFANLRHSLRTKEGLAEADRFIENLEKMGDTEEEIEKSKKAMFQEWEEVEELGKVSGDRFDY